MLSSRLDTVQAWAGSNSISHFQLTFPLKWIAQPLTSTNNASIKNHQFTVGLVVYLFISMGL